MTTDDAKFAIHTNFPKFQVNTIQFIAEGFDNTAFEVNNDYIFRFTRSNISGGFGGSLEVEQCVLPKLQKHITAKIPDFIFYGKQSSGLPFVGYEKINGQELSPVLLDSMLENDRDKIFKTISTFFNEIHAFPISIAIKYGVETTDFKERYAQDSLDIEKVIPTLLNTDEYKIVKSWIADYLNDNNNFIYTPSFIDADLWLRHILVNENTHDIEGIIDFSDMTIGDPDYDYIQICSAYPKAYDYFEKYISAFDIDTIKRKTGFFKKWNTVQNLMLFIQREDKERMAENLAILRKKYLTQTVLFLKKNKKINSSLLYILLKLDGYFLCLLKSTSVS